MKTIVLSVLCSLAGAMIMALSLLFRETLPDPAAKLFLFIGCCMFGYGIALIIGLRAKPSGDDSIFEDPPVSSGPDTPETIEKATENSTGETAGKASAQQPEKAAGETPGKASAEQPEKATGEAAGKSNTL